MIAAIIIVLLFQEALHPNDANEDGIERAA